MHLKIERKFLVNADGWNAMRKETKIRGNEYRQGYLNMQKGRLMRIRLANVKGFIGVLRKAGDSFGLEFEFEIPQPDAFAMLYTTCIQPVIRKTRYHLSYNVDSCWQVDTFTDENEGLILAKTSGDSLHQKIELPGWIEREVTNDAQYCNANLVANPYQNWKINEYRSREEISRKE